AALRDLQPDGGVVGEVGARRSRCQRHDDERTQNSHHDHDTHTPDRAVPDHAKITYLPGMAEYVATITWSGNVAPEDFVKGKYSREHAWAFDGGVTVPASPAPTSVPKPWSNPANVDPEEAFVASISSCHMLTFL